MPSMNTRPRASYSRLPSPRTITLRPSRSARSSQRALWIQTCSSACRSIGASSCVVVTGLSAIAGSPRAGDSIAASAPSGGMSPFVPGVRQRLLDGAGQAVGTIRLGDDLEALAVDVGGGAVVAAGEQDRQAREVLPRPARELQAVHAPGQHDVGEQ